MSAPRPLVNRAVARQNIGWQLLLLLGVGWIAWLKGDKSDVVSALLGAGIALAGSAYFAWQAFRYGGARAAPAILNSFYRGEAGKFALTVFLFVVVFRFLKSVHVGWLFAGFILLQLAPWLVLISQAVMNHTGKRR